MTFGRLAVLRDRSAYALKPQNAAARHQRITVDTDEAVAEFRLECRQRFLGQVLAGAVLIVTYFNSARR